MKEIIISQNEAGQRVNKFLLKYLNKAPSSFVYKMIRKKNIKLNNKKIEGNEYVYIGDTIQIYMSDETIANFREDVSDTHSTSSKKKIPVEIIYLDENILIADKPTGVLSQKASKDDYSFNEALIDYLLDSGHITTEELRTYRPSVCNRLDRNTSGLILCGVSLTGSQELSRIIREHLLHKYYYTLVRGRLTQKLDRTCYLQKENAKNIVRISDHPWEQGKSEEIHSIFYPVKKNDDYTLVKVELITGKSHQIRAQLKHLGDPVVGDTKYGIPEVNRYFADAYHVKHQLLHCGNIIFKETDGPLSYLGGKEYSAFLPEPFRTIEKDLFR